MIKVIKKNGMLSVSFSYDSMVVANIKTIPGRKYDPSTKTWSVPFAGIKKLIELFGARLDIAEDVDVNYEEEEVDAIEGKDFFRSDVATIENNVMKVFADWCLSVLPDYFFTVAASSTGKYHPQYALGTGGLARHTKAAMMICNELFACETIQSFNSTERDCIRVALLIHDGVKHGLNGSPYVTSTHPLEVVSHIEEQYRALHKELAPEEVVTVMESELWQHIANNIKSHMGQWNTDFKTKKEILPKPQTEMQKFTHLCDYLASRKMLEVRFE